MPSDAAQTGDEWLQLKCDETNVVCSPHNLFLNCIYPKHPTISSKIKTAQNVFFHWDGFYEGNKGCIYNSPAFMELGKHICIPVLSYSLHNIGLCTHGLTEKSKIQIINHTDEYNIYAHMRNTDKSY